MKDNKYWAKRRRNNEAAKMSREAKRRKENQIVMRAAFLEVENSSLRNDVKKISDNNNVIREDLTVLRKRLSLHQKNTGRQELITLKWRNWLKRINVMYHFSIIRTLCTAQHRPNRLIVTTIHLHTCLSICLQRKWTSCNLNLQYYSQKSIHVWSTYVRYWYK